MQLILNQPVTINGYSQPGASANTQVNGSNALPLIELKSANPGFNTAFFINVSDCVIRGLVINNFDVGISINGTIQPGAFHTTITGCFIGTNAAGNLAAPNTYGILVNGSSDNIIGGVSLSARNLISGNTKSGISMSVADGKDSKNNLVAGNLIGTDKSGTGAIGNGNGIFLYQVNGPNTIGAAPPLARNVISGNVLSGISLSDALNTLVIGNYIGTNAAGTGKVGNGYGVFLAGMSVSNKIGTSGAGNLISGNTTDGIRFGNCVGDFCPVDNQVAGNLIGTGADGTSALGNTATGIFMEQAGTLKNTIGGTASDSANVIAFNGAGVISSAGRGNAILRNSIFSNTGPGIDLKGITGPNANDLNDLDTGPNNLQNFPVIASAVSSNGITTLSGTLNSEDNKSYRIEFFANQQCDASGFGEGTTFLSATNVVTSGHNASFSVSFLGFNLNQFITATATDPDGNTSEFSQCRQVTAPSPGNLQFSVGSSYFVSESDGALTVNITRTNGSAGAVTVNYATSNGSATAGSDYTAVSGTLQFGDGVTGQSFNVPITDDSVAEGTENVILTLSNPTGGALLGNPVSVGMWISDDDPDPKVSINDVSIAEGNSGATNANFTVSLSNPSGFQITVDFATMAGGTATPGNDYQSAGGTLTFAPGETSKLATVIVNGDAQQEPNETFVVHLANVWYAGLGDAQGIGTIIDDDAAPTISISDISLGEGNGGTTSFDFSVSLSAASGQTVTVDFSTAGGTATSGVDFQPANNTLTFNPGETSKTITVMVNGDPANEPDETFFVNLSNPINTAIIKTQGVGTIKNDDAPQSAGSLDFSAQTYSVNENGASAVINVKRTGGSSGAVSVQYVTGGGTATDGSDYTSAGGTLNWADGDSSDKSFSLAILEDALNEPGETVSLSLSGPTGGAALGNQSTAVLTIADNDSQPGLSISDASLAEGNSGTTGFNINVTLSAASGQTVNVDYLTADGTALVGGDYQSTGGTLTFAPGETSKTVSVLVNGDTQNELDETFFVNLSNPVNATALKSQGKATVVNDDNASPLQTVQFSEASYSAQEDLGALTITVTRSGDASAAASVDYSTMDDKA
ncbi:MAG: Calx-beta domain-containing protein, partial [Pyrinomonadaceae bacterium]